MSKYSYAPSAPEGFKGCSRCRSIHPATLDHFSPDKHMNLGLASWCRRCTRALDRERYLDGRRKPDADRNWRASNIKKVYGLTMEGYDALLDAQGGVCAICEGPPYGKSKQYFDIDHDHVTGRVRGLLCTACNRALGLLKEDEGRIARCLAYLREGT